LETLLCLSAQTHRKGLQPDLLSWGRRDLDMETHAAIFLEDDPRDVALELKSFGGRRRSDNQQKLGPYGQRLRVS